MVRAAAVYLFSFVLFWGCATTESNHTLHEKHLGEGSETASVPPETGIAWHSLSEGRMLASEKKMPMIIDFYVPAGCPRCEAMSKNVYSDPNIIETMNRDFIPIRINLAKELTEEEKSLGEKYSYRQDCLLLFLDRKGDVIEEPGGKKLCFANYVGPDWFLEYLKYIKKNY